MLGPMTQIQGEHESLFPGRGCELLKIKEIHGYRFRSGLSSKKLPQTEAPAGLPKIPNAQPNYTLYS